jgi:FKBP-type peptidyl-prolyl cis-trans isomerase SlyD
MGAQVVSFNCILKNKAGQFISSTFSREVLTGPVENDMLLAGLAKALQNLSPGEKRLIELKAEEAYGLYFPDKIILFPKKKLPQTIRAGECVLITAKDGKTRSFKVLEFYGDLARLDGNHPLAGQDLIFEIETLAARDATPEEITESMNMVSDQMLH